MHNVLNQDNNEGINQLVEKMHSHIAWHANINVEEAEKILYSLPQHTFLLRSGESDLHYFFSYVSKQSFVFHKSIRINPELLGYYSNGGTGCDKNKIYHTVEPLISEVVGCPILNLLPLANQISQAQGF